MWTSQRSGNWSLDASNPASPWFGGGNPVSGIPALGQLVTIASPHVVTVDGTHACGNDTANALIVNAGGTLRFSETVSSQLTVRGEFVVNGTFTMGTIATPIPAGVTATLVLNESTAMAIGKWGLFVNLGGGIQSKSAIPRTKNTTSTNVGGISIGATSITVVEANNWAIGDTLCLMATDGNVNNSELVTVTSVSGLTIGISACIANHAQGFLVGNFSSNIVIRPFNPSFESYTLLRPGSANAQGSVTLQDVAFIDMGQVTNADINRRNAIAFNPQNSPATLTHNPFGPFNNLSFLRGRSSHLLWFGLSRFNSRVTNIACFNLILGRAEQVFYSNSGASAHSIDRAVVYRASTVYMSTWSFGTAGGHFTNITTGPMTGETLRFDSGTGDLFEDCNFWYNTTDVGIIGFSNTGNHIFRRCNFGVNAPGTGAVLNVVNLLSVGAVGNILLEDCSFNFTGQMVRNQLNAGRNMNVSLANRNLNPTMQEIYTGVANVTRDNAVFRTNSPSLRISPIANTSPYTMRLTVFAPNNAPVQVSGFWRGDSAFVGSSATLSVTLSGLGITPSVYNRPMGETAGAWNQFTVSGVQTTGTDGMLNLDITVQGNVGSVNFDDISAPPFSSVNTGEFGYWSGGQPSSSILANFVSASDIWSVLTSNLVVQGSIGALLRTVLTVGRFLGLK